MHILRVDSRHVYLSKEICEFILLHSVSMLLSACQQYDINITIDDKRPDDLSFHIFGGIQAQSGEFPYMVALGYENDNLDEDPSPIKYSCGGSLISSQHVLTAAHCVNNVNEKVPVEVGFITIHRNVFYCNFSVVHLSRINF